MNIYYISMNWSEKTDPYCNVFQNVDELDKIQFIDSLYYEKQ